MKRSKKLTHNDFYTRGDLICFHGGDGEFPSAFAEYWDYDQHKGNEVCVICHSDRYSTHDGVIERPAVPFPIKEAWLFRACYGCMNPVFYSTEPKEGRAYLFRIPDGRRLIVRYRKGKWAVWLGQTKLKEVKYMHEIQRFVRAFNAENYFEYSVLNRNKLIAQDRRKKAAKKLQKKQEATK